MVLTRGIAKTSGFTRGVWKKKGIFIKIERFSSGVLKEQPLLRNSKAPRKSQETWTFQSLAFYNAPSLHTIELSSEQILLSCPLVFQPPFAALWHVATCSKLRCSPCVVEPFAMPHKMQQIWPVRVDKTWAAQRYYDYT